MSSFDSLIRFWERATRPHPSIVDLHPRSRARVLATVLLFSAALDLTFALIVVPGVYGRSGLFQQPEWWFPAIAFVASMSLWRVSTGPNPQRAATGLSIFATASIWMLAIALLARTPDARELQRVLVPILLAQLFTGTFLPFRNALWIGIANLLGLTLIPFLAIRVPLAETAGTAALFGIAVVTILAASWLHQQDLEQIRKEQADRAIAEEELGKSRRLESLGRLAGGVAHDFNNMLTSILARIDASRGQNPTLAIARELDGIEAAADRAASLVRRLLDQGRPSRIERSPLDLFRFASETAELVRPSFPSGLELRVIPPGNPVWIEGDPEQLAQVLVNLIQNARDAIVDARSGQGSISIDLGLTPEALALPAELSGTETVCCSITDTGPGFSSTSLNHLFEPFFTTKGIGKGTGLGLWNCLGTIQAHGGTLVAANSPMGGAIVHVVLPKAEPISTIPATTAKDSVPSNDVPVVNKVQRILLVDDEETIREHGAMSLRECGYEVAVAGSGEKALERFDAEAESFSLVVLDLSLPGISGRETCGRILARKPSQKVLIVTGFDLGTGLADPEVQGASGRLLKPFRMAKLVEEVQRLTREVG